MSQAPILQHEISPLSDLQVIQLLQALNPARVQELSKPGSGKLSYVAAWDIRRTLTRIFGFGGWSLIDPRVTIDLVERDVKKSSGNGTTNFRVTATVTVTLYIHQLGAMYAGTATASQSGSVLGDVQDFAIKTADSDAFKRAAMNLGTQFGLSLYDHGSLADVIGVVLADGQRRIDLTEMELKRKLDQAHQQQRIDHMRKQLEEITSRPVELTADKPVEQPTTRVAPGDSDVYVDPEDAAPAEKPAAKAPAKTAAAKPPARAPRPETADEAERRMDAERPTPNLFDEEPSGIANEEARADAQNKLAGAFGGQRPPAVS